MSLCIVDGDLIGFKAAAACETRFIIVTHKQSKRSKQFNNRTEFKEWLKQNDRWSEDDFEIQDDRAVEPIANCLHTVKAMLKNIQAATGCSELKVVVQGEGNFRDNIPLPVKYKSGRQDMIRPHHLGEVKDYLLRKYKAEKANGCESDDILSMYAWEGYKRKKRYVQCTIDKDAKQCSGYLYDWDKMSEPKFIEGLGQVFLNSKNKLDGFGRKWLYYQATVGDPSDSYKPTQLCKATYGEKSFFKDFADLKTDKECWQKIHDLYLSWYPEEFMYTDWTGEGRVSNHIDMMQSYFDCAHMRRWKDDRIVVKDILDKMGVT